MKKQSLVEQLQQLKNQNRFNLFDSEKRNFYLYDVFSQNLYPVNKMTYDFFITGKLKRYTKEEESKIQEFLDYLSKWNGQIKYSELTETHLTINLSSKCNLNCSYCYRDKEYKNEMSLEKAFEIIDYADKYYKTNNNEIVFSIDMTAESFLDKEKIKELYKRILDYKGHQKMRLWFMSNGTRLTDDYIELIKQMPIDPFWVSLDGPETVHNANRKYYNGKGSFNDVIDNIKILQENNINIKISCVLTSNYPYPDKLFNYLKSLSVQGIQICPVRNGCEVSLTKESLEIVKESYVKLFEQLYIEIMKKDFSSVKLLKEDFILQTFLILFNRIRQSGRCTWGQEAVVDAHGNMYPCLYVIGNKKYLLGNINEKKNARTFLRRITVNDRKKCQFCWARFLCGGTCHYNSIISKNSEFEVDDIECELRMFLITESINMIIKLMEKGADLNEFAIVLKS